MAADSLHFITYYFSQRKYAIALEKSLKNIWIQALSEWTKMEPQKRVESLRKFGKRLTTTPAVQNTWERWGMKLESEPKSLTGRVLPPEQIFLKNPAKPFTYRLENADWTNCKCFINFLSVLLPISFAHQLLMNNFAGFIARHQYLVADKQPVPTWRLVAFVRQYVFFDGYWRQYRRGVRSSPISIGLFSCWHHRGLIICYG